MSKIGIVKDEQVCPVRAMWDFKERIQDKRQGVTDEDTFFLSGINTKKPWPINEDTVANIVKKIMQEAGIDMTRYTPHSIRSATSTFAVQEGVPIDIVKEHANWSKKAQTFERYYYKSRNQFERGSQINDTIFL
ncbi:hypothetical protein INT45_000336 [Circinella minor]|uniref:Tyr recombinase domain-containing protein n=1 Tax=Circinella minor TaxID=1195481 RepID=A0A8H7RT48_9FUNG|nr:hypothetical protein INT45_000336 [Circinella minor]